MFGIGEYAENWFYTEYSMYTPVLSLWIKGCQLFRNYMWDATHNKSFGSVLKAINEVRKRIYYVLDNIFVFFCR